MSELGSCPKCNSTDNYITTTYHDYWGICRNCGFKVSDDAKNGVIQDWKKARQDITEPWFNPKSECFKCEHHSEADCNACVR